MTMPPPIGVPCIENIRSLSRIPRRSGPPPRRRPRPRRVRPRGW
jgi:hypothetical protein